LKKFYMTTPNILRREMCIPPAGFEPAIPTNERPKSYALDRAAGGVGPHLDLFIKYIII